MRRTIAILLIVGLSMMTACSRGKSVPVSPARLQPQDEPELRFAVELAVRALEQLQRSRPAAAYRDLLAAEARALQVVPRGPRQPLDLLSRRLPEAWAGQDLMVLKQKLQLDLERGGSGFGSSGEAGRLGRGSSGGLRQGGPEQPSGVTTEFSPPGNEIDLLSTSQGADSLSPLAKPVAGPQEGGTKVERLVESQDGVAIREETLFPASSPESSQQDGSGAGAKNTLQEVPALDPGHLGVASIPTAPGSSSTVAAARSPQGSRTLGAPSSSDVDTASFVRNELERLMVEFGEVDLRLPEEVVEEVRQRIAMYQGQDRKFFQSSLNRSVHYVPMIELILAKRGVPADMAYMALVESGFRPDALSSSGARGLWQFLPATASTTGSSSTGVKTQERIQFAPQWLPGNTSWIFFHFLAPSPGFWPWQPTMRGKTPFSPASRSWTTPLRRGIFGTFAPV